MKYYLINLYKMKARNIFETVKFNENNNDIFKQGY